MRTCSVTWTMSHHGVVLIRLMNLFSFPDHHRIQGCHPNVDGGDKLTQYSVCNIGFPGLPFGGPYWPERPLPRLHWAWKLWHCNWSARWEVLFKERDQKYSNFNLSPGCLCVSWKTQSSWHCCNSQSTCGGSALLSVKRWRFKNLLSLLLESWFCSLCSF